MRIEQILYFRKLAECGSITAASQQLYISQQALSTAIMKLEKELQTTLFIRTSRGVYLTADGEYLLAETNKLIEILEQINIHFLSQNASNVKLNIGAIPVVSRYLLPKSISFFYKNLPNVHLDVSVMAPNIILESVINQKIDLGFILESSFDSFALTNSVETIQTIPLFQLPFSIVMHKNHPLSKHRVLSFKQLANYPALVLSHGDLDNNLPYSILTHYNIESIITVDNEILYNQFLEDGLGYGLYTDISPSVVHRSEQPLVFRSLKEELFSTISCVQRKTPDNKTPYIKIFCDQL